MVVLAVAIPSVYSFEWISRLQNKNAFLSLIFGKEMYEANWCL